MAEVMAVWSAETADVTAVLLSCVPPTIPDCLALLMGKLNAWYAARAAWLEVWGVVPVRPPAGCALKIAPTDRLWASPMSSLASYLSASTARLVELARPLPALCNSVWRADVYPLIVAMRPLPLFDKLARSVLIAEFSVEIAAVTAPS